MFQQMTKEVRCLIRGLALAYGTDDRQSGLQGQVRPGRHYQDWDVQHLDLAMLETELNLVSEFHPDSGLSCGPSEVYVNGNAFWAAFRPVRITQENRIHIFSFGAYGCTHVLAFGSLEDALEDAAETLKEVAPGLFANNPDYDAEAAEADLTYTESGWLPSWEWTVTSFDSLEAVLAWQLRQS